MRASALVAACLAALAVAGIGAARRGPAPLGVGLRLLALRSGAWGGQTTAHTGEVVTVYVSGAYPWDPAIPRRAADFLSDLYHGPELATVTIQLAPPDEVERVCGSVEADGCYWPGKRLIVAPGADLTDGTSAESVLAHEYGHHVAASRDNAPWPGLGYGTKRWASYEYACSRSRDGTAFPGDSGSHYALNPGEAFAETYRLLNFNRLGRSGSARAPWNADESFTPDRRALQAVRDDVLYPWAGPSTTRWSGDLGKPNAYRPPLLEGRQGARARKVPALRAVRTIRTPLDGTLTVTLIDAPPGSTLTLLDSWGGTLKSGLSGTLTYTVCGERSLVIGIGGPAQGRFEATIATP